MYIIRSYQKDKEIASYINFGTDLPSIKDIINRFKLGTSIKLFKVDFVDDNEKEILEISIYKDVLLGLGDDITRYYIQTYKDYIPSSFVEAFVAPMERIKQYSIELHHNSLSNTYEVVSVIIYDKHVDIIVSSLGYYGNNLHGTQLIDGKYTIQYNHGRIVKMHRYTGGLFSFGTRLEEIPIDYKVVNKLKVIDDTIRDLLR